MITRFDLDWHIKDLIMWEGFEPYPYLDTEGVWTIGFGSTRWDGVEVDEDTTMVTVQAATVRLKGDAYTGIVDAAKWAGDAWNVLSGPRQAVLANMHYQMGAKRMRGFINTKNLVRTGRCRDAAVEMLRGSEHGTKSAWFIQTERRAQTMSTRFAESNYHV